MTKPPKKKRRRKVPRNIVEKTDREAMTRIFGKRVMKEVDQLTGQQPNEPDNEK